MAYETERAAAIDKGSVAPEDIKIRMDRSRLLKRI